MKKLLSLTLVVFTLLFITSCNKDSENAVIENTATEFTNSKWNINNSNEYSSIEFNNSGNYIIVKEAVAGKNTTTKTVVINGTYVKKDDETFILSDYGIFKIISADANQIKFALMVDGKEITFDATKQEEMKSTTKTELLSKTWEIKKIEEINTTTNESTIKDIVADVLFSKAGTYLVMNVKSNDPDIEVEQDNSISYWKWSDESETKFYYSRETPAVWSDDAIVDVTKLTEDILVVTEYHEFTYNDEIVTYKTISTLVPKKN